VLILKSKLFDVIPPLVLSVCFLAFSLKHARHFSPTDIEPAILASGMYIHKTGKFDVYPVNPPLTKAIAGLAYYLRGTNYEWEDYHAGPGRRAEYAMGRGLCHSEKEGLLSLLILARHCMSLFPVVMIACVYYWSLAITGSRIASLLPSTLLATDPNFWGHGSLITNDIATVAISTASAFCSWHWLKHSTWTSALFSGCILGLAQLTKFSCLLLYPPVILFWALNLIFFKNKSLTFDSAKASILQLATLLSFSVYIINLGYLFEGSGTCLRDFEFVSSALTGETTGATGNRFQDTFLGTLPMPLPYQYIIGCDLQQKDLEYYKSRSYLNGIWQDNKGWCVYYLYGIVVKLPHATHLALIFCFFYGVMAIGRTVFGASSIVSAVDFSFAYVFTHGLLFLLSVSLHDSFSIHFRYAFPCLSFFLVGAAISVSVLPGPKRPVGISIFLFLLIAIISNLQVRQPISYFNWLAGGSDNGWKHMLGSSFDWGQDLLIVKECLAKSNIPIEDVSIKHFRYSHWDSIYPEIDPQREGTFKYFLVGAESITQQNSEWRAKLPDAIRICDTAWLFPATKESN
jgi:hypothetical protein